MACFAAPSFHDGNGLPSAGACAAAGMEWSSPDRAGSMANVESMTRRLIPDGAIGSMVNPFRMQKRRGSGARLEIVSPANLASEVVGAVLAAIADEALRIVRARHPS